MHDDLLTDTDLLAELLGGRGGGHGAAARAIAELGGLGGVARTDLAELAPLVGGVQRARRVLAALALGERIVAARDASPLRLASAEDVGRWASPRLGALEHEELWVLGLDGRSRLRGARCVARGGLHGLGARASDVLRAALRLGASGFVLVHNHPSGDPTPSAEDVVFTARTVDAGVALGIPLLDHVVVAGRRYASVTMPSVSSSSAGAPEARG